MLKGITIIDFSSLLPCPFSTYLLAKFGARVIKIESPNRPDPAREFGYKPPGQTASCYRAINDIKELVWLDLKNLTDREKAYDLVRNAHGAIEGYRPEVRKRLGIEYETLAAINPALVYLSMSGFDPNGPHRDRAGHDINFVARSGIFDQTRDSQGHCVLPCLPVGDYVVAYAAALRLAFGLLAAKETGKGRHIEVSIEEALLEAQHPFLKEIEESGHAPRAGDSLVTGKYPCYRLYELPGGTLAVGALEEKFWVLFCNTIARPDLISSQFATGAAAQATAAQVLRELAKKSFADWVAVFKTVDCCVEPVLTVPEALRK